MFGKGTLHEEVRKIQDTLRTLGHDPGPSDGYFGPVTAKAVAAFQQVQQLVVDTLVGPKTAEALGLELDFSSLLPPPLRRQFTLALLDAKLKQKLVANNQLTPTHYEELLCLGYEPLRDRLQAIVAIKQSNGYKGNPCEGGSREHVRFYVDWRADGTWTDLGVVGFDVNDLPYSEDRHHAVHLSLAPERRDCGTPVLPRVRAILAWNEVPPANSPDWTPVWGNRLDARIQIAPKESSEAVDASMASALVIPQQVFFKQLVPKSLLAKQLPSAYHAAKVPVNRWGAAKIASLTTAKSISLTGIQGVLESLDVNAATLAQAIGGQTQGNTNYERLCQLGYDSDRRSLSAIIHVAQNTGYSGSLCEQGSPEYVAFWRWDDDSASWLPLGIANVEVHDIEHPDRGPLSYAVVLPVDFGPLRRPCTEKPTLVRVRATLSWNHPPSLDQPNWVPTWGNRLEARFDIETGQAVAEATLFVQGISTRSVCELDPVSGLWDPDGALVGELGRPFGGEVMIDGRFSQLAALGPSQRLFYRIEVRPDGGSWETLANPFRMWLDNVLTGTGILLEQAPVEGWYEYRERPNQFARLATLGVWNTTGKDGLWEIQVTAQLRSASGELLATAAVRRSTCTSATPASLPLRVLLDNTAPTPSLSMNGGPCRSSVTGTALSGTFSASDAFLSGWSLDVLPGLNGGTLTYSPTSYEGLDSVAGTWTLTGEMSPCGYVIRFYAHDRTIIGSYSQGPLHANYSSWVGRGTYAESIGFCVTKATT